MFLWLLYVVQCTAVHVRVQRCTLRYLRRFSCYSIFVLSYFRTTQSSQLFYLVVHVTLYTYTYVVLSIFVRKYEDKISCYFRTEYDTSGSTRTCTRVHVQQLYCTLLSKVRKQNIYFRTRSCTRTRSTSVFRTTHCSVRKYFRKYESTFVLSYNCTKVATYIHDSYPRMHVVRKYEGTVRVQQSTWGYVYSCTRTCTAVHVVNKYLLIVILGLCGTIEAQHRSS